MDVPRTGRRELLAWTAAFVASRPWLGLPRSRPAADDVLDRVRWISTPPREPALRRAARELCAGLDPERLLGALLLASAREIRTDLPRFGLLVPSPDVLIPFETDAAGDGAISAVWPLGLPVGLQLAFQSWFLDPGAPQGFSATNAALVDSF